MGLDESNCLPAEVAVTTFVFDQVSSRTVVVDDDIQSRKSHATAGPDRGMRWRLRCYPAVTSALELASLNFRRRETGGSGQWNAGLLNASALARSGGDLYVTYEPSKSGRGGRIRTGDPLRPSATSCNHTRLCAASEAPSP
jgi:hypothetical protein